MVNKKKSYSKGSANSELNPHLKQPYISGSEKSLGDSLIKYNQPELFISHPWEPHYILSKVDEEVSHTIIHFLCTGNYKTLRTASKPARKYDLYGLQTYAKKYIKIFSKLISIFDRMEAARETYSKLPQDKTWLASYINKQLQVTFSLDTNIFKREEFYDSIGREPYFNKAVIRMATETIPAEGVAEDGAVEDSAIEDGAMEDSTVEDGAIEDGVAEECGAVEDDAVEEGATQESTGDKGTIEDAINLKIPTKPAGTTLSFK
ncbi:uncharacterized protein P174DRAFT_471122 [Aspergillus novofumigatus IBT 16806]|uniref:Uncharacterized protein n=1 Tax=Aspergillus novofumigatus (strain IBT 16806) TaxID=1392255 RepID=A0A2I1BTY5_ASPN1|nr:uncharacterized protein P174DRAFT_471122 [Aspergillus novofumigatus IBT 16806]PKX88860.1 hypothetical protein P174DRAFT_471122 [Aspergillus novofumigatus IBT 16806]